MDAIGPGKPSGPNREPGGTQNREAGDKEVPLIPGSLQRGASSVLSLLSPVTGVSIVCLGED